MNWLSNEILLNVRFLAQNGHWGASLFTLPITEDTFCIYPIMCAFSLKILLKVINLHICTVICLELRMNLTNIAEHRIKLLFKKSEGRATKSDLKHVDRLEKLMQETKADSLTLEEDKSFMEYAKWMIAALESKSIQSAN